MALPDNPLPACPDTPNCVRVSKAFPMLPDTLFRHVQAALGRLRLAEMRVRSREGKVEAVVRVFVFKDDVVAVVEASEEGSILHLRSSSRVGRSDYGVNRRRVHRVLRYLDAAR